MIFATPLAQAAATRIEWRIELARWTVGGGLIVGVAVSLALGYLAVWLYRNERRGEMRPLARYGMIALRMLVLLLLGLMALEPVAARYLHRRTDATTLVLVDDSASMAVRDLFHNDDSRTRLARLGLQPGDEGLARTELARHLLSRHDEKLLRDLAARNRVAVASFSESAAALRALQRQPRDAPAAPASSPASQPIPLNARGPATDLGRSIRDAIRAAEDGPISGVVLLSDGGVNQGESIDAVARFLKSRRIPLLAVGVGDPAEPLNARIADIAGPRTVFARDPFRITVEAAVTGGAETPVDIELWRRGADEPVDAARRVEQRTVRPAADGRIPPQAFDCRIEQAGRSIYTARIAGLPREAVESDNTRELSPAVTVLDNRMRVLLVAGAPSYEYRALAKLLERDETIDLSCWLQSADARALRDGDIAIDHLPATREELLAFDAIVLLDPDPEGFDPQWATLVAAFIDDAGGGLLYAADAKHTATLLRGSRMQPLVAALPIVPDPEADLALNAMGRYQRKAWPIAIPADAVTSPLLQLVDDSTLNSQAWARLDGVYWHFPVRREKPAATVLMRHANPAMTGATGPHVLLATQFVGAGRTAFLGFNSTWRWVRSGEQYYARFWVQTIRYLMEGKLLGGRQRGTLATERERYELGESIVVTLRALNERYEPLVAEQCELVVESSEHPQRRVPLTPVPGRDGHFQGRFIADRSGGLRLSVTLPEARGDAAPIVHELVVEQPDIELRQPAMRRDNLQRLAELAGGKYLDMDEAAAIPDAIADCSESVILRERPLPLWDNGWVFAGIVGLLTLEWIMRKRARLL